MLLITLLFHNFIKNFCTSFFLYKLSKSALSEFFFQHTHKYFSVAYFKNSYLNLLPQSAFENFSNSQSLAHLLIVTIENASLTNFSSLSFMKNYEEIIIHNPTNFNFLKTVKPRTGDLKSIIFNVNSVPFSVF